MNDNHGIWRWLILAATLPIIILAIVDLALGLSFTGEAFKRFSNALLTAYILAGILLTGNLFFYAGSRKRPLAPIVGMGISILAGVGITILLLSQGELLMENNGSVRAQILYNIVHLLVSTGAIMFSGVLVIGCMFASLVSREAPSLFDEEE